MASDYHPCFKLFAWPLCVCAFILIVCMVWTCNLPTWNIIPGSEENFRQVILLEEQPESSHKYGTLQVLRDVPIKSSPSTYFIPNDSSNLSSTELPIHALLEEKPNKTEITTQLNMAPSPQQPETNLTRHDIKNKNADQTKHIILSMKRETVEGTHTKSNENCNPVTKIVFIKTHKTGSTTASSIFQRFGYRNKLMFALPRSSHIFANGGNFERKAVLPMPRSLAKTHPHFNILTNHAIYNRKEMEAVVPNATYITIIRDPVTQLESAFGYYKMAQSMGISNYSNPLEIFMQRPSFYHVYTRSKYYLKNQSKNGQLLDLGLNPELLNDTIAIRAKIDSLDKELDFVILTEYFDESLVLMKNLLCWSYDDILFIKKGLRNKKLRLNISDEVREKIRQWNIADALLYDHFNRTFWKKVDEYGSKFWTDVNEFRRLQQETVDKCVDPNIMNTKDVREDKFVLKKGAGDYCKDILREDVAYTPLIRKTMLKYASHVAAIDKASQNSKL